jgi:hypothetical protein
MPDPDAATSAAPAADQTAPTAPTAVTPAAAPEAAPAAAAEPVPGKYDALVDLWFAECIQNTEIGRYTGAYNVAFAAKEELKRRLA